ncbi:wall-associated receptor kinase-like 1 [Magnolia sinica]|uniref:wall-associated receptor kinase-like 1 n=1 Tax=Magnolia sinica TaxID=86752 RepID=UPI00265858A7|nr:wall-associated receptor kinase-like 1 [Magnolia sinica]
MERKRLGTFPPHHLSLRLKTPPSGSFGGAFPKKTDTERRFLDNGARLLQDLISSCDGKVNLFRIFSEEELRKATDHYDERRILGKKGTFTYYKGTYEDRTIVVRTISSDSANEDDMNFVFNEIVMLSQISHRNVVKLLGCCLETEVPMRVYEFVPNGSLYQHIHETDLSGRISWENRLRIVTEVADALTYLHASSPKPIIHMHIKPSNILLDGNYTAKLTNFRISVSISPDERNVESAIKGTVGYIDPEYASTGLFTEKSDVFGFGLLLLELLTGEKTLDQTREELWLGNLVMSSMIKNQLSSIVDVGIMEEGKMEQFTASAELALRCIHEKGEERPTMKEVVQELKSIQRFKHPSSQSVSNS